MYENFTDSDFDVLGSEKPTSTTTCGKCNAEHSLIIRDTKKLRVGRYRHIVQCVKCGDTLTDTNSMKGYLNE